MIAATPGERTATVAIGGEIDLAVADVLESALKEPFEDANVVLADLRGVTFMDCAGVHAIRRAARAAKGRGHLLFVRPSPAVDRLFELTGGWQSGCIPLRSPLERRRFRPSDRRKATR